MLLRAPVIEDAMNNHPLWFNAIAVEALLHHGILAIDGLPLLTVDLIFTRTIVVWWRFIHVIFTLVVPIHDGVIQLQLWVHGNQIFPLNRFHLPEGFSNKIVLEYTSFCDGVFSKKLIQNNYKMIKHNQTIHWLEKMCPLHNWQRIKRLLWNQLLAGCCQLTCSSLTHEQCQYERPAHFTKNSLCGRPFSGGLLIGSLGFPSGPAGSSAGSGGSLHVQWRIFWTLPLRGGH